VVYARSRHHLYQALNLISIQLTRRLLRNRRIQLLQGENRLIFREHDRDALHNGIQVNLLLVLRGNFESLNRLLAEPVLSCFPHPSGIHFLGKLVVSLFFANLDGQDIPNLRRGFTGFPKQLAHVLFGHALGFSLSYILGCQENFR